MPQLTESDVRAHVGQRSMRRVRWYDVDDPTVQGQTLFGRVAGFQVQAELEPLSTRCSCLYRQRCDHAAVLLMAWVERPERFTREQASDVALPADRTALLALLEAEHGVLLDSPVEDFLASVPAGHPLQHRLLDRLETVLRDGTPIDVLLPALAQKIDRRQRRLAAIERARVWRTSPPEEAVLAPIYQACRDLLDETDLHTPPGHFGRASLGDAETLVFRLDRTPHHAITVPIQTDLLEGIPPLARRDIAGIVLDTVVGHADEELRREVLEVLATPLWQRSLAQLDAALALVGPRDRQQVGWRVEGEPLVERVVPVQLTPYARRAGFRTKKLNPAALAELDRASDRAALGALRAKAALPMVLEQLVEHPAIVDESGELLHVRYGDLTVVVHEGSGWRVELQIDGRAVDPKVLAGLRSVGGLGVVRLGSSVFVLRIEPVVEGLIGVLSRFGEHFPRAARKALVERLQVLESAVPLELGGTIRGEELEQDLTPELRLVPLSDGALRVELRVRPLPGGPPQRVGEGSRELSRVEDGKRLYVRRQLLVEPERVRRLLGDLPLPAFREGSGTVDDPNQALELVWQLRQRDDVRVVWPQQRLTVRNEVKSLRVGVTRRRDWFGLEGETEGASKVSLKELLAAVRAGRDFVPVDDRAWLRITVELQQALKLLATAATDEEQPRVPALAASRALLALESAALTVELPDELVDLEARIRAADAIEPRPTPGLQAELRPYQLEGVTWLRRLRTWAPGAILADEMGLGKTLQALALILETGGRALVVAPASVNFNWQREAQRFAPDLPIHLYRGPERAVEGDHGVWITSYELLVRDLAELGGIRFDTVVFDEAQALKNPLTQRSKAARSLDAGFVLALSGTPVENHLLELWSLLRVVAPGLLGPREHFLSRYGQPLMSGEQLADGRLSHLLAPFLLRRTKRAVAPELPPREETVEYVELDAAERVLYERFRRAAVGAIGSKAERMQVLAALTRLRQIACAARLVDADAPAESSKLRRLCERCEEARENGEQVLVFSQFTGLLDLAAQALERRSLRLARLDGRTPMARRREAVDGFQAGDADVFLIALKAGGTGLNLTAATTVILLDPWWNPAAEDQASDRAHRIGQQERVQVIRLVSAGTVEEQVLALHAEKRVMAERVLDGAEGATALDAEALLSLLAT